MGIIQFRKQKQYREEKTERLLSMDFILVMLSAFGINFLGNSFVATMPLYTNLLTGSVAYGGIAVSVYSLTAIFARLAVGVLADKIGRVKLLVAGALLCSATCLALGFTTSIVLLIGIRIISGIGFGMHSTCAYATAGDIVPKKRLAEGVGYFGLANTLTQMIGPAIALAIVSGGKVSDYRNLFFTVMFICLVSAICSCGITYERKRKKSGKQGNYESAESASDEQADTSATLPKTFLGIEYTAFAPGAVIVLVNVSVAGMMCYVAEFANWRGFSNSGLFFIVSAVGIFISRLFLGRVVDKHGADIVNLPALVFMVIGLALLPLIPSSPALIALAFPIGLCQGAIMPALNSIMFKRCTPARRGTTSATYSSSIDTGYVIGASVLGVVADMTDYGVMFWAAAASCLLALAIYLLLASEKRWSKRRM